MVPTRRSACCYPKPTELGALAKIGKTAILGLRSVEEVLGIRCIYVEIWIGVFSRKPWLESNQVCPESFDFRTPAHSVAA